MKAGCFNMTNHFIGTTVNGQRARFAREINDQEFTELLAELDGELPQGFFAWHFDGSLEYKKNRKAQAVAKLPIVIDGVGAWVDPVKALLNFVRTGGRYYV
jgi:hypothetical protein